MFLNVNVEHEEQEMLLMEPFFFFRPSLSHLKMFVLYVNG